MATNEKNTKLGLTVDEAREMLGIGRNLMLKLVKVKGFPAVRFKRKIIINKELLPKWFEENSGEYGEIPISNYERNIVAGRYCNINSYFKP